MDNIRVMEYQQPPLMRYPHSNNSLLSSGNVKKSTAYEPRTEAISPAINDDIINAEDSTSKSTKDEQTLIVEKLKKVEAEIVQTDLQIVRLRRQKEQLEQAQAAPKHDEDQENVCDTKQLSIAKLVYHENRAKAQKAHAKLDGLGGSTDLPVYNQPSDNVIYHFNSAKFSNSFKSLLIDCFKSRFENRLKLEDSVSTEYDRRMEKWLKSIELEDSQPSKRLKDAKTREFFEKQFPELKKARESGERFSRVGQRVARSDAEVAELLDGITEREDQDKKIKSYAVIPPMLEEMRSKKPKFINNNGYVEDIVAEYKEYQILNTWTDEEKEIFRENYLQHPKDFGFISRMTNRKNVANCVHYYYISKKSENYKQLLKRQQKRRTRSFVRPAATTPANPDYVSESNKTNGITDNQAGDSVATDLSEPNNGSKTSALNESIKLKQESDANSSESCNNEQEATCCICNCYFSDNNQFRNVTRSNHQLYGIGLDTLKPGMKICYSCRFRHVKQSKFDESTFGVDQSDKDMMIVQDDLCPGSPITDHVSFQQTDIASNPTSMMEVDAPSIKSEPISMCTSDISEHKPIITPSIHNRLNHGSSNEIHPGTTVANLKPPNDPNIPVDQTNKDGLQRTYVRDIIYQAIEMSFQKPTNSVELTQTVQKPVAVPRPQPSYNPMMRLSGPQASLPSVAYRPRLPVRSHREHIQAHQLSPADISASTHQQISMPIIPSTIPHSIPPNTLRVADPPMAHSVLDLRGSAAMDEGVLNLSAKSAKSPESVPVSSATPTNSSTPSLQSAPVIAAAPSLPPQPSSQSNTAQHSEQDINREDSRSPSEMVIDESVDGPSPDDGGTLADRDARSAS